MTAHKHTGQVELSRTQKHAFAVRFYSGDVLGAGHQRGGPKAS